VWKNCDAIFEYGGYVYVNDDLDSITEWPTMDNWEQMGYKKVSSTLIEGNGNYIKEFVNDSQFPWMTFSKAMGGDSTNPVGDSSWTDNDSTMRYVVLGGSAWYGASVGPFFWASNGELLFTSADIGCLATAFPKTN
jgi:hypothetical protein